MIQHVIEQQFVLISGSAGRGKHLHVTFHRYTKVGAVEILPLVAYEKNGTDHVDIRTYGYLSLIHI